jgi:hypothetical protein
MQRLLLFSANAGTMHHTALHKKHAPSPAASAAIDDPKEGEQNRFNGSDG